MTIVGASWNVTEDYSTNTCKICRQAGAHLPLHELHSVMGSDSTAPSLALPLVSCGLDLSVYQSVNGIITHHSAGMILNEMPWIKCQHGGCPTRIGSQVRSLPWLPSKAYESFEWEPLGEPEFARPRLSAQGTYHCQWFEVRALHPFRAPRPTSS